MAGDRKGSILLIALVAVLFAGALALSLASRMAAALSAAERHSYRLEATAACRNAVILFVADRLIADTNGFDHLGEKWNEPWERREEGWVMRVSGSGFPAVGPASGVIDEERRLSAVSNSAPAFAELLRISGGMGGKNAEAVAAQLENSAPFTTLAEVSALGGMEDRAFARVRDKLTTFELPSVNVNTAAPELLEALFGSAGAKDSFAAANLVARIRAFREAGNFFTSAESRAIAKSLGGLPADEAAVLDYCSARLTVASDIFSGVAEAADASHWEAGSPPRKAHFTYNRKTLSFLRWVEE